MITKFKNDYGQFVTEQQVGNLESYYRSFFDDNNNLVKDEVYFNGELMGLRYYNNNNENHQTIVTNNTGLGYSWFNIVEYQMFGSYRLERVFEYEMNGTQGGTALSLHNPDAELIAYGHKDQAGVYDFEITRKFYYDRAINPERELFECTYHETTGNLLQLYWNNYHIDEDGQESFVLLNTPSDIQTLINLTGMSQELAEYYMDSDVVPNF
ncbi:MAG TPA: hypothetical protein VF676_02230 [Flavobacterium sp.]|jgi:hypothetical protein